MLGLTIL